MSAPRTSQPIRDAALALSLLTALPVRVKWPSEERPDVAGYFPFVGLVLGSVTAFVFALAMALGPAAETLVRTRSTIFALLVVAVWAAATRMLHWDGLADVADAVWGAHGRERRLEIMADSAIGAFGTTAIVLVGVAQVASLAQLLAAGAIVPLVIVPVAGRLAASYGAWLGAPARPGGLGAAVAGRPGGVSSTVALGCLAIAAWLCFATMPFPSAIAIVAAALVLPPVVPHLLSKPFGGVTGDVLGASVLLTESAVLLVAALVVM